MTTGTPQNDRSTISYMKFAAMIMTATAVAFALLYVKTHSFEHLYWSETRFYMALVMGGAMTVVLTAFMFRVYGNTAVNLVVLSAGICIFAGSLYLVRSQSTVDQVEWMKEMIPHHSSAILTSQRANIADDRVRQLAEEIIRTQQLQIEQMQQLITELESRT